MTLIELDRDTPLDPGTGQSPPPRLYRPLGLVIAVLLAVVLGGAAQRPGTRWEYMGVIPPTAGVETPIQLAGGHLFTVAPAGARRILTAWTLEPAPARLWSADLPASVAADPANGAFIPVWVRQSDDVVLVTAGMSTTAIESGTGRIRWTTGVRITVGDGGVGMVVERIFRPGTVYDQDSGEPGMLYFSADGQPHTEPPIRTEVRGVDLATGRTLWTADQAGSVIADPVPGEHPGVLITASDRLTLHDARTGAVLRETALPERAGAGPSTSDVLAGVALVGYDEAGLQAGYDTSTLDLLWTRDLRTEMDPPSCTGLLCAGSRDATEVLDPSTGRTLWALPSSADLTVAVGHVLRSDPSSGAPVRLQDPSTGAHWVELAGWTDVVESFADVLVVRRADQTGGQAFGIVRPGRPEVRTLGVADIDGRECGADDRYVVCRDVQGLRIWAYHG